MTFKQAYESGQSFRLSGDSVWLNKQDYVGRFLSPERAMSNKWEVSPLCDFCKAPASNYTQQHTAVYCNAKECVDKADQSSLNFSEEMERCGEVLEARREQDATNI